MSRLGRPVVEWMRDHHATATTEALAACGVSPDQRRRLVESGVLDRLVDGAYSFAGTTPDELARCAAVCGSRPHLIVAGPTAGRLWEIRRSPRDGLVHVIAPPASQPCRAPWVKAYRTALVCDDEIVRRSDGIRLDIPAPNRGRPHPLCRRFGPAIGDRERVAARDVHAGDARPDRVTVGHSGPTVGAALPARCSVSVMRGGRRSRSGR